MSNHQGSGKKGFPSVAVGAHDTDTARAPDPASRAAVIEAVASRVLKLSVLQPEDIAELMESEQGSRLMDIDPLAAGAGGGAPVPLQSWSDVKVASPAPSTDAQYERFLKGQDPLALRNPEGHTSAVIRDYFDRSSDREAIPRSVRRWGMPSVRC